MESYCSQTRYIQIFDRNGIIIKLSVLFTELDWTGASMMPRLCITMILISPVALAITVVLAVAGTVTAVAAIQDD